MNDMNPRAAAAASWTHKNLTQENKEWLLALPYLITEPTYAIVHGSPNQPELFYYVIGERAITNAFKAATRKVTFVGHSHHPDISELQPTGKVWNSIVAGNNVFNLHPWASYIVNVGSIGQPRDRDTRASFVVYDDERRTATWHRVAYNIAVAQAKIRATSLPPDCADRLGVGK
jgi:diadenosine tetraphosphatase ApaH/serine/threonine PP2A family protein phosphatase